MLVGYCLYVALMSTYFLELYPNSLLNKLLLHEFNVLHTILASNSSFLLAAKTSDDFRFFFYNDNKVVVTFSNYIYEAAFHESIRP
jgi:hypothetical protein